MMKKTLLTIFLGILIIIGICIIHSPSFNEKNVDRQVCIKWPEVNVREGYSTRDSVITTLEEGDTVFLTGRTYEYWGGNGSQATDNWTEVQLSDGTIGWIVNNSIDW